MSEKPGVLLNQLTNNQFSRIGLGAILNRLTQVVPASWKLLNINVDRYKRLPSVTATIPTNTHTDGLYQAISETFPTFPLIVSSQLKSQVAYLDIGQQLQISCIGSLVAQHQKKHAHIEQFLKNSDPRVEIGKSLPKGTNETPYLPRLIYGDLMLIAKGLHWKPSQQRHEMIEHLYCMNGLSQIFLRYYYDLIAIAETDELAQYIHEIFFNFFVNIRLQEAQYWKNYSVKVKTQIEQIIAKDSVNRHPVLRQPFFEQLNALHPIIHHGGSRQMTMSMKTLLDKQLDDFRSFSFKKMSNFLQIIAKSKAPEYVRYLLLQVVKGNPKKIVEFHEFSQSSETAVPLPPELQQVLTPIVQQVAPPPKPKTMIVEDEYIRRRKQAQRNMENRANIAALTSDQLTGYFNNYLKKLYERSAKKGALTQDKIADYLERFSKNATKVVQRRTVTPQEKQVFEESIEDTLHQLGGQLNKTEMEDFQEGIKETLQGFEEADIEERAIKIEELGDVMTAVAEFSDLKQDALDTEKIYKQALAIELQVDDDPAHMVTVERFLSQPITLNDKMKYLKTHTPDPISIQMMNVVEKKQQLCSRGSSNPIPIFGGSALLRKALVRLLFPHNNFRELLQKEIIPILPEQSQPPMTVREFFTFPLAEKKKGPAEEEEWFKQHIFYLELAREAGKLEAEDVRTLVDNIENFPTLKYKKYFSIVRKERFEDTSFMAVYFLWQNNGLEKIRISS